MWCCFHIERTRFHNVNGVRKGLSHVSQDWCETDSLMETKVIILRDLYKYWTTLPKLRFILFKCVGLIQVITIESPLVTLGREYCVGVVSMNTNTQKCVSLRNSLSCLLVTNGNQPYLVDGWLRDLFPEEFLSKTSPLLPKGKQGTEYHSRTV